MSKPLNIEELSEAAKTLAKMGTMSAKLVDEHYMALCGADGGVIRWTPAEVTAVALAANALPRLLAEKAAVQDVLNESSAWVPDGGHPDAKVREGVLAGFGMALARMRGAITEALARP